MEPSSSEITDEMIEAAVKPMGSFMGFVPYGMLRKAIQAARSVDPLVAEAEGLRRENERLRERYDEAVKAARRMSIQLDECEEENERLREAAEAVVHEWRKNDDLWPDHRLRRLSEPMRLLSMRLRSAELEHQTPAASVVDPVVAERDGLQVTLDACRRAMRSARDCLTEASRRDMHMHLRAELEDSHAAAEWYEATLAALSTSPGTTETYTEDGS